MNGLASAWWKLLVVSRYIAELPLFLEKDVSASLSSYAGALRSRLKAIVMAAAANRNLSGNAHAEDMFNDLNSSNHNWTKFRNAGLCGSQPPRGIIFTMRLIILKDMAPRQDFLSLVKNLRSEFKDDPRLDGNLLELETILEAKNGTPIYTVQLELDDGNNWKVTEWCHSEVRQHCGSLTAM